mmetsp:Transcript_80643/g.216129  ORF Transcript_80643/g.216129 Transcript_80643/m.216129 type:complete len:131 (-) Transcript_80643:334-726(-)
MAWGQAAAAKAVEAFTDRKIENRPVRTTMELELKALREAVQSVEGERDSIIVVIRKLEAAVQEHEQTATRLTKEIKSIKRWSFGGFNKATLPLEVYFILFTVCDWIRAQSCVGGSALCVFVGVLIGLLRA